MRKGAAGASAPDAPPGSTQLLQSHRERRTAIQPSRLLAAVVVLRPFLTVADGLHAVGRDSAVDQILTDCLRAAFAEREVVFGRADVAGVTFDRDAHRCVGAQ